MIHLFLNELNLTSNHLKSLNKVWLLPSLEKLYLENNKIESPTWNDSKQVIYMPNLKVLNLDNNKMNGFASVWKMLRFSKNLEILKYDNN